MVANSHPELCQAEEPHVLGSYGEEFGDMLVPGKAKVGEPQFEPAKEQARRMEKCIHDQLLDTNAVNVFRKAIFESALLGTGIVKGPFNFHKRVHNWERGEDGERDVQSVREDGAAYRSRVGVGLSS